MKKMKKQEDEDEHSRCCSPKPNKCAVLLGSASHLTRAELLRRRLAKVRLLSKCYRQLYWALMERLKAHFRQYLWHFGLSPFRLTVTPSSLHHLEGSGDNNTTLLLHSTCSFLSCHLKPIPFSSFCHFHILSDSRQTLYKPCSYVIKSAQAGPITCGKPILRSTVPSLCTVHFQKAQKHLNRTFKRTGLNVSSTHKTPPKFHLIVTEYVRQIQFKRRTQLFVVQKET